VYDDNVLLVHDAWTATGAKVIKSSLTCTHDCS